MDGLILNRSKAALYLGVDRRTLLEWERAGYGPKLSYTPKGAPIYARAALDAWLKVIAGVDS